MQAAWSSPTIRMRASPFGIHQANAKAISPQLGQLLGVLLCVALVAWRRNLFIGLAAGVLLVAILRVAGLG